MTRFASLPESPHLSDVLKTFPKGVEPLLAYHDAILRSESPLTVAQRELIAAYVSGLNACGFCFGAHSTIAQAHGVDEELFVQLVNDPESAGVEERMLPLLAYVKKLTEAPASVSDRDAEAVFAAGWEEQAQDVDARRGEIHRSAGVRCRMALSCRIHRCYRQYPVVAAGAVIGDVDGLVAGGGHHHGAVLPGVVDGGLLGTGQGLATDAEVDYAGAVVHGIDDGLGQVGGPASALHIDGLEHHDTRSGIDAGYSEAVIRGGGDNTGDQGAVAVEIPGDVVDVTVAVVVDTVVGNLRIIPPGSNTTMTQVSLSGPPTRRKL